MCGVITACGACLNFLNEYEYFPMCMNMFILCACSQKAENRLRPPELGPVDSCASPCKYWQFNGPHLELTKIQRVGYCVGFFLILFLDLRKILIWISRGEKIHL